MLLCGGGTGGHVYPALAVVEALRSRPAGEPNICYVGAAGSVEEDLAARWSIPFERVESGQFRGKSIPKALRSLVQNGRGLIQARRCIRDYRPDVVFSTGGYASVPALVAARLAGRPIVIYLPDIEPGLAIRLLSKLADRVAVSFDEVARHFAASRVLVTGYPVRVGLHGRNKEASRERLGLAGQWPVLLAFGGSQGARSINQAVVWNLAALLEMSQIVHITGSLDYQWVSEACQDLPPEFRERYHCHEYMHEEMLDALNAADLILARAGASTLAEFPAVGAPSILVPYPYSGRHQYVNAGFMARHGAAEVIEDADLADTLVEIAGRILRDPVLQQQMSQRSSALARPEAARDLARELHRLAGGSLE